MPQPIPYLAFDGNCGEAMRFYAKVLDGKLDMLTFGQSPMADQTPKDAKNRIMHARPPGIGRQRLPICRRLPAADALSRHSRRFDRAQL